MISRTKKELYGQEIKTLCGSAGFSEITNIRALGAGEFNAVYAFDAGRKAYALKVAPDAGTPVMTYEKNMMRTELFWYEQLRKHTDIAIPEIIHIDTSRSLTPSDFFIMELVPGRQMNETEFTEEERPAVAALFPQMAAKMHRIGNEGFGYLQNGLHDTWTQALTAMAEAVLADAETMGKSCENGETLLKYIRKHASVLDRAQCRMVNYDLWAANVICERMPDGFRFVLIDPERGFWGDPVMDFMCFEWGGKLKDKKVSLAAYNKIAQEPITIGRDEEIRFAFAQAYLGIIMEVERYYRYIPGDEGWTRNDRVCQQLFDSAFGCLDET